MHLTDWKEYHQRRRHELETILRAAKAVLAQVGPPRPDPLGPGERGRGRPPHASSGMFLVNLLRIRWRMPYRDIEAYLAANEALRRSLGLAAAPGRNTIHVHAQAIPEEYLRRFNESLTARLKKTTYALPSTRPVSRSRHTRDPGALPRIPRGPTRTGG